MYKGLLLPESYLIFYGTRHLFQVHSHVCQTFLKVFSSKVPSVLRLATVFIACLRGELSIGW